MKAPARFVALVVAMASMGGRCATGGVRPDGGPAGVDEALARLARRTQGLNGVGGFAKIEAYQDGERIKLTQVIVAQRPAKLRIETLSPFDQPISYLATDGERLSLQVLGEGRFLTGAATAENVGRLFPLAMSPGDVVEVLLGGLVLPAGDKTFDWDAEQGNWVLTVFVDGQTVGSARLRADDLAPLEVVGEGWSLQWEKWDEQDGFVLPRRLRFRMDRRNTDVSIRWDDRTVNPDTPVEAWTLQPPRGVAVESLD